MIIFLNKVEFRVSGEDYSDLELQGNAAVLLRQYMLITLELAILQNNKILPILRFTILFT